MNVIAVTTLGDVISIGSFTTLTASNSKATIYVGIDLAPKFIQS